MKVGPFLILAALFCSCMSGCKTVRYLKDISQVSYTSESGTILPEEQWHEQIVITRNKVTLARNGKAANTEVNAGIWEFAVDEQKVTAFFEQLEAIDCSSIKKVEPDQPTEGGGTFGSVVGPTWRQRWQSTRTYEPSLLSGGLSRVGAHLSTTVALGSPL